MPARKYDFSIEQGSSFTLSNIYKDQNQNIVNITNWCGRIIWTTNNGQIYIFSTENTNPDLYRFYIDGPNGLVTLVIPPSVTNTYNFSTAKYDFELLSDQDVYTDGEKNIVRVLYGDIFIIKRYSGSENILQC